MASSIRYGPIAVTVDESRFQIVDHGYFDHPSSTTIVDIIKRYFGKLLVHTPLQIGGVNFNGLVVFRNLEDEWEFDRRIGISRPVVQSWAKRRQSQNQLKGRFHKGALFCRIPGREAKGIHG